MQRLSRWWRWLLAGAVLVVVLVLALRSAPQVVDVGLTSRGPLTVTIDEEGETRVRDRFVVATPVTGRLQRLALTAGDSVRQGDLLATIESTPLDPRARQELTARLEAALDGERMAAATALRARETLEQARRERARVDALFQRNIVAPETRERAVLTETNGERDRETAEFRARAAAHEVEQARAALASQGTGRLRVRAPAGGRVLRILEPNDRVVLAGTPLVELGDPSRLEVVADLLSTDAVRVRPGDSIRVHGWGGADTLLAVLRRVEPSGFTKVSALGVEELRVNVVGDLIAPPPTLGDRYRADIQIAIWQARDVLRVPRSALFRTNDQWRVFVVQGGRARERAVTIGHQGLDLSEVVEGLAAEDQVVLHPDERVTDGVRVTPRSAPAR